MNEPRDIYTTTVREHNLDVFGHMNHADYFVILEEARWEMLTKMGYGLEIVRKTGIGPIVLEATCRFKKEIRLRDKLTIETFYVESDRKVGRIRQEIYNQNRDLCAAAEFRYALFDTKSRKLVSPTEAWEKALSTK